MFVPIWLNRQIGGYDLDRNSNTFNTIDADAVKAQVKSSTGLTVSIISPNIGDELTKDSVIEVQTIIGAGKDDGGTDVDDFSPSQLSEHQSVPEANMGKNDYEQGPTIAGLQTTVAEQGTIIAVLRTTVAEQGTVIADLQTTVADLQTTNVGLRTRVVVLEKQVSDQGSTLEELREQMREAAVEKSAQEIICGLQDVNGWRLLEQDQNIKKLSSSFFQMRTARNDVAHFILIEDRTGDGGKVAALKAKMFAGILGALTTEITQGIVQKGVNKADAIVQAVRANLDEFSGESVIIPDEIAAEANQFFKYTLRVLGKDSATDLL